VASAAEAPRVPEADSVAPQLAELNAARAALEAGAPARALAMLDDFDLRHPSSALREEVAVLRVDALVDAGRLAEANDLAAAFLRAYPGSAYGQHVRSKVHSP
jgi:outer membrane protein assembly factor BamD (BamD/ComL family)